MKYLRELILRIVYPILKGLGEMYPERTVTLDFVTQVKALLQPGDVFITRENMCFTNLLIPGFYTHAAIYTGNGFITEATGIGVHQVPVEKFLFEKDHVMLLRAKFTDADHAASAANIAKSLQGDPYDFDFTGDNTAFYCAEVVWYAYDAILNPSPFREHETWGVNTVTPQDFYNAVDLWSIVTSFGDKTK